DHSAHGFALPASPFDRNGGLWRGFQALQVGKYADPGRHHLGKLGASDDGDHARRFFRSLSGDLDDTGMRMRGPHIGDVHHARQGDIADILTAALREPLQVWPRHRSADIGVRSIKRGQYRWGIFADFHTNLIETASAKESSATYVPKD